MGEVGDDGPICHQCGIYRFHCPVCGCTWVDDGTISYCEDCHTRVSVSGKVVSYE